MVQTVDRGNGSTSRGRAAAFLLLVAGAAACDMPNFEGAQIQEPPPAFFIQNEAFSQLRVFPWLEVAEHQAWVETGWGHFSAIFIDAHAGVLTEMDARAAQDTAKARAEDPITFGPIESLTIDGRRAWGWSERLQTPEAGIDWIGYKAVVPYDTITYALEFHGGEPGLKAKPDTAKVVLMSFGIGETTLNLPLIAVLAGVGLFALNFAKNRAAERQQRLQSITLKQVPKKKPDGEGGAGDSDAGAPPPSGTPQSGAPPPEGGGGGSIADAVRKATGDPPQG